jgi:DNA-directed RNA polymerase specialized sigma24 family protein
LSAQAAQAAQRTVEAVWRIESARLIAALARVTGDVGLAEDLAQDALVAALEQWPSQGVPDDNPGAWLTAVARRRYVDTVRRAVTFERKAAELDVQARLDTKTENPMDEIEFDTHVTDDVLRLIFTACHPVLTRDGRVALTLKLVGGLSTEQVARAKRPAGPLHPPGRARRLPCPGGHRRRHRLAPHRRALRDPRRAQPVPGHRAQPRRRGRHGGQRERPRPRPRHRRFPRRPRSPPTTASAPTCSAATAAAAAAAAAADAE